MDPDSGRRGAASPQRGESAPIRGAREPLGSPAPSPFRGSSGAPAGAPAAPAPAFRLIPLPSGQRARAEEILRATAVFREDEVAVALEVIDAYHAAPGQDYHAVGAFTPGEELLGFIVFGPTPCTLGTWDLYWIAVHPEAQGGGVGATLTKEMERRLARIGARLVLIETSSRPAYDPTRAFYRRRGYEEVARVPDFYEPGDDRVIFAKRMDDAAAGSAASAEGGARKGATRPAGPTLGGKGHG